MFAGKEVGWALAKMSFEEVYINNLDTTGMNFAEREGMEEWIVKVRGETRKGGGGGKGGNVCVGVEHRAILTPFRSHHVSVVLPPTTTQYRDFKGYPIVGRLLPPPVVDATKILPPSVLSSHNGLQPPSSTSEIPSIYVGAGDYVFDVSYGGCGFYKDGCSYHMFAGKDASVALGKMSFEERDINGEVEGMEEGEKKVLRDWIRTFRDKKEYPVVGRTGNGFRVED